MLLVNWSLPKWDRIPFIRLPDAFGVLSIEIDPLIKRGRGSRNSPSSMNHWNLQWCWLPPPGISEWTNNMCFVSVCVTVCHDKKGVLINPGRCFFMIFLVIVGRTSSLKVLSFKAAWILSKGCVSSKRTQLNLYGHWHWLVSFHDMSLRMHSFF